MEILFLLQFVLQNLLPLSVVLKDTGLGLKRGPILRVPPKTVLAQLKASTRN